MKILCKLFGHKWNVRVCDSYPSTSDTKPLNPGFGGGKSLSVKCTKTCDRCHKDEEYREKWD